MNRVAFLLLLGILILNPAFSQGTGPKVVPAKDKIPVITANNTSDGLKPVVLTLPRMDEVLMAEIQWMEGYGMYIYYPPDFKFNRKLPVVILVTGWDSGTELQATGGDLMMNSMWYINWGQLFAASGIACVSYNTDSPQDDLLSVIKMLGSRADELSLDSQKMVLWGASRSAELALITIAQIDEPYASSLWGAVWYYGPFAPYYLYMLPKGFKKPLYIVKQGEDDPLGVVMADQFIKKAKAEGVPMTIVEYPEGPHWFDVLDNSPKSRQVIQGTLDYVKNLK